MDQAPKLITDQLNVRKKMNQPGATKHDIYTREEEMNDKSKTTYMLSLRALNLLGTCASQGKMKCDIRKRNISAMQNRINVGNAEF
jgi:hypothetical protein